MHRLTGAKLTKLIDVQLVDRDAGLWNCRPCIETTAHTKPSCKSCQARMFYGASAKLKLNLRLADPPCFISSQFEDERPADLLLNSRYWSGFTGRSLMRTS